MVFFTVKIEVLLLDQEKVKPKKSPYKTVKFIVFYYSFYHYKIFNSWTCQAPK